MINLSAILMFKGRTKYNNTLIDNFSLMAVTSPIQYPNEKLEQSTQYYQNHFLESLPASDQNDQQMTFIVEDKTDLLLFAQSAEVFWRLTSNYPYCFKGTVRTRKGNCFATFNYVAGNDPYVISEAKP